MNARSASQRGSQGPAEEAYLKGSEGEQPHFPALCTMDARTLYWLLCALHGSWALPLYSRHGGSLSFAHSGPGSSRPQPDQYPEAGVADTAQSLARQCQHMSRQWGSGGPLGPGLQEDSAPWRLRVLTAASGPPRRPIFPHQHLFHYIKRIYSCCKQGFTCRKIKGLQGRVVLDGPLRDLEFYVDSDTLELSVERSELHLEVSNPDRVTVIPVLSRPGFSSSSHTEMARGNVSDLTLDIMFLFDMLREDQRTAVAEMTLNLHCFQDNVSVPCDHHGVGILRSPFIALLYK